MIFVMVTSFNRSRSFPLQKIANTCQYRHVKQTLATPITLASLLSFTLEGKAAAGEVVLLASPIHEDNNLDNINDFSLKLLIAIGDLVSSSQVFLDIPCICRSLEVVDLPDNPRWPHAHTALFIRAG
jgi:hypothetical protein